jgi:hypothetical protein
VAEKGNLMSDEQVSRNVFENQKEYPTLPVTVFVDGEKKTIGMASMVEHDGHIHVSMDLNGDPALVKAFLGDSALDVSLGMDEETVEEEAGWRGRHGYQSHKPATNFGFPEPPGPIHKKENN